MFNGFVALTDETESGKKKKKMEKGSNGIQFSSQSAGSLSDRSNKSLVFFYCFSFSARSFRLSRLGLSTRQTRKKIRKKNEKKIGSFSSLVPAGVSDYEPIGFNYPPACQLG